MSSIPLRGTFVVKDAEEDAQGTLRSSRRSVTAKGGEKDAQTSLRLPRELYEQVSQAAGDHGIGEEIRQRLQRSFDQEAKGREPIDLKTRELASAIANVAAHASGYYRPWHGDAHTFEVVKAAIDRLLAYYQPKGEPVPYPNPDNIADLLWGPAHSSEEVGAAMASLVLALQREGR
jgi:hypothetical protein